MTFERVDERAECSTQKLDEDEEDEDTWQWLVAPRQEETLENILEIPHFFISGSSQISFYSFCHIHM